MKIFHFLLLALVVLLPIQTHYEFTHPYLQQVEWDFAQVNLYGTDILFILALIAFVIWGKKPHNLMPRFFPLLVFSGILLISTAFSPSQESWYMLLRFLEGLGLVWLMLASGVSLRTFATVFVISMTANAVFGLWQFATQTIPESKWLGMASQSLNIEGAAVLVIDITRYFRSYGTFPYPNIYGLYLAVAFLLCLGLFIEHITLKAKHFFIARASFLLACGTILCAGLLFSFSRSAWLGASVGVTIMLLLLLFKLAWKQVAMLAMFIGIVGVLCTTFAPVVAPFIKGRVEAVGVHEVRSKTDRKQSFQDAFSLLKVSWWSGIGLGRSSYDIVEKINEDREAYEANPSHNMFLLLAVEASVFSALALVFIYYFLFADQLKSYLRHAREKFFLPIVISLTVSASLLLMSFFGNYLPTLPSGLWLLFFVLGISFVTLETTSRIDR